MKNLIISMLAMAAMVSCTSENDPIDEVVNQNKPVAIAFGQSINLYTKAPVTGTQLQSSTIGLWAQEYTDAAAWKAGNFMDNEALIVDGSGNITYTNTKYYSLVDGTRYNFYAFAPQTGTGVVVNPATAGAAPSVTLTLSATLADQTDLMYATPVTGNTKSASAVALTFKHSLAQIKFTVKKAGENGATTLQAIKVNANSVGTMNISDGTYTGTGTPLDFNVLSGGNQTITAEAKDAGTPIMLFPESLGNNSVTFTIDGTDYPFTPTATLNPGKITTINVTISATGVSFSQSSEDWGNNDSVGSGTI